MATKTTRLAYIKKFNHLVFTRQASGDKPYCLHFDNAYDSFDYLFLNNPLTPLDSSRRGSATYSQILGHTRRYAFVVVAPTQQLYIIHRKSEKFLLSSLQAPLLLQSVSLERCTRDPRCDVDPSRDAHVTLHPAWKPSNRMVEKRTRSTSGAPSKLRSAHLTQKTSLSFSYTHIRTHQQLGAAFSILDSI